MDMPDKASAYGVFFTQNPSGAVYHARRNDGNRSPGGRVYRVELITENPYFADVDEWVGKVGRFGERREIEADLCSDLRMKGFDAVVTLAVEDTIFEIIVFDDKAIQRLDDDIGPLKDWSSPNALDALLLYRSEATPSPA